MKIEQCNRNPFFLADFAYDGDFSDGNHFCLRIPEEDVVEFAETLLKAYRDDKEGRVVVRIPMVKVSDKGTVIYPPMVIKQEDDK